MKRYFWVTFFLLPLQLFAQDTTINNLLNETDTENEKKEPVKIFNNVKAINANTTEMVGKGKMDFRVTHNFDDIDGKGGIFGRFLGLDNVRDVRIAFHVGLTDRLDVNVARVKGASIGKMYELALKYQLTRQLANDPSHPFAIAVFVNNAISTIDTADGPTYKFKDLGDRMSQTIQIIIAKKIGKISLQLNPTLVNSGYVLLNDKKTMFALGGAIRLPITNNFNLIVDYFHPFRSRNIKDSFAIHQSIKFYDPIGISFEILTAGHVFNLNFTNATEILENRFIPRTVSSWTKGKFRWGFTISRKFSLWREKN